MNKQRDRPAHLSDLSSVWIPSSIGCRYSVTEACRTA